MLYTKIQPWSFLGSWEVDFNVFLPYMGRVDILFDDAETFEQIDNTPSTENPNVKSDENWSSCFRKEDV